MPVSVFGPNNFVHCPISLLGMALSNQSSHKFPFLFTPRARRKVQFFLPGSTDNPAGLWSYSAKVFNRFGKRKLSGSSLRGKLGDDDDQGGERDSYDDDDEEIVLVEVAAAGNEQE